MTRTSTAAEEWLLPVIVLKVVTVIAVLVSGVQAAVWATICLMTLNLMYAWWLWSALIAGAVVASLWAYNAILVRIVDDESSADDTSRTVADAD
ncbi:MAG: hypothetical protein L0K86_21895 [Actinomycetia bacterium]|nr:hypothetical protein [Actinomycetes bacterium]